jgi:hypothetical protein
MGAALLNITHDYSRDLLKKGRRANAVIQEGSAAIIFQLLSSIAYYEGAYPHQMKDWMETKMFQSISSTRERFPNYSENALSYSYAVLRRSL